MAETPNPGSEEALDRGCICAVLDNCRGRLAPIPPDGWIITEACPVHGSPKSLGNYLGPATPAQPKLRNYQAPPNAMDDER